WGVAVVVIVAERGLLGEDQHRVGAVAGALLGERLEGGLLGGGGALLQRLQGCDQLRAALLVGVVDGVGDQRQGGQAGGAAHRVGAVAGALLGERLEGGLLGGGGALLQRLQGCDQLRAALLVGVVDGVGDQRQGGQAGGAAHRVDQADLAVGGALGGGRGGHQGRPGRLLVALGVLRLGQHQGGGGDRGPGVGA